MNPKERDEVRWQNMRHRMEQQAPEEPQGRPIREGFKVVKAAFIVAAIALFFWYWYVGEGNLIGLDEALVRFIRMFD